MSAHTPGPWSYNLDADERGADVNTVNGDHNICNCGVDDAPLIAVAPELAALVLSWSSWYRGGQKPEQLAALGEWMHDVLAKAEWNR